MSTIKLSKEDLAIIDGNSALATFIGAVVSSIQGLDPTPIP